MLGIALIVVYLIFDGFTSTTQERMFTGFKMSINNQMVGVNAFSIIISLLSICLKITLAMVGPHSLTTPDIDRLTSSLKFSAENPQFLLDVVSLSVCSTLGQFLIYHCIKKVHSTFNSSMVPSSILQ